MAKEVRALLDPQPPAFDKIGNLIESGDIIAYGHALGRSAALRIGKVVEIRALYPMYLRPGQAVTPEWRITVQGVEDGWGTRPKTLCRLGTLQFPDRVVVLGKTTQCIPDKGAAYANLLADV